MKITFEKTDERVKISDFPVGTIFTFDGMVLMKIRLIGTSPSGSEYSFLNLETGLRLTPEIHKEIDYGSVDIFDAELILTRRSL